MQSLLATINKLSTDAQYCQNFARAFSIMLGYITNHNCSQYFEIIMPLILINVSNDFHNIHTLKISKVEKYIDDFVRINRYKKINYSRVGIKAERGYSRFEMYCAIEISNKLFENQEYFSAL